MRLLDVGCGWASLLLHAAQHYGARAVGVTLVRASSASSSARGSPSSGLRTGSRSGCRTTARSTADPFDAVASIEMGEHVGQDNYPVYAAACTRLLRPGGRLLLQQMSAARPISPGGGAFMERYVAPGHVHAPARLHARTSSRRAGLEVRDVHSLREHYVLDGAAVAGHLRGQPGRGGRG